MMNSKATKKNADPKMILLIKVSHFMCMKIAITKIAFVVAMINATGAARAPKCILWNTTVSTVSTNRIPKICPKTLAGIT